MHGVYGQHMTIPFDCSENKLLQTLGYGRLLLKVQGKHKNKLHKVKASIARVKPLRPHEIRNVFYNAHPIY